MGNKRANVYKGKMPFQSGFDRRWACWARNHRGWAKMKKYNRRLAKRRIRQQERRNARLSVREFASDT